MSTENFCRARMDLPDFEVMGEDGARPRNMEEEEEEADGEVGKV